MMNVGGAPFGAPYAQPSEHELDQRHQDGCRNRPNGDSGTVRLHVCLTELLDSPQFDLHLSSHEEGELQRPEVSGLTHERGS